MDCKEGEGTIHLFMIVMYVAALFLIWKCFQLSNATNSQILIYLVISYFK